MPLVPFPRARRADAVDAGAPRAFVRQVADALSHLYDVARLQTHPLALRLDVPERAHDGLGRALQRTLLDAIEGLRPTGRGTPERPGRIHRLLVLRYIDGHEPADVWVQLGIGKSEYYREHSHGLAALASLLWERLSSNADRVRADTPARSARVPQRLPRPLTSFVGRGRELAELAELLQQARLVTLTGPPGSGKTRLALRLAGLMRLRLPEHVVFVGLAPVAEPRLVLSAVAQALGLQEQPGRAVFDQLVDAVSDRDLLLVLDNFEHVVGAAVELSALLAACPAVRLLVTSRERLRVSGEHAYEVSPLDESEAVQLFVERARSARADFMLAADNAVTVAAICARVDRLPLAIELAASRVRLFGPTALLARLERRLPLLSDGPRDYAPRQQALRDTIAWSYDLLEPAEQDLFSKLAVCVGGCSLAAIEALCGDEHVDALASLVEKSMLHQAPGLGGEPRFSQLETLREFALERLEESGLVTAARHAHAGYFRALAEQAEAEYFGPADGATLDLLEQDYANLRAAIEWALEDGELEVGLALGGALWRFLFHRDHLSEGRELLRRLIAAAPAADPAAPSSALAKALFAAASLAVWQGESPAGRADADLSVGLYRDLGDKRGEGYALHTLAHTASDRASERDLYAESAVRLREAGDLRGVAWSLQCLGNVTLMLGDPDQAHAVHSEGLAVARQSDSPSGISGTLTGLGRLAERQGDHVRAYALYLEGFELRRQQSDRAVTDQLNVLGRAALGMGEPNLAAAHFAESLELCRKQGIKWDSAFALAGLAEVELRRGERAQAATLLAAADAILDTLGARRSSDDQAQHERMLHTLSGTLGEPRFRQAIADGRAMTRDEAIDAALLKRQPGPPSVPAE